MIERLDILTDLAAAITCLCYAWALTRGDRYRPERHRLAFLLFVLALALGCRGISAQTDLVWILNLSLLGRSLFPLAAALYVESITGRSLHQIMKFMLLMGTVAFVGLAIVLGHSSPQWQTALLVYEASFLLYASAFLARAGWLSPGTPRKRFLLALSLVGLGTCLFIVKDHGPAMGPTLPHLGPISALLLIYLAAAAIHSQGRWRTRTLIKRLLVLVLLMTSVGGLARWLQPHLSIEDVLAPLIVLILFYAALEPLRLAYIGSNSSTWRPITHRFAELEFTTVQACLDSLGQWPELEAVDRLNQEKLVELGYTAVQDYPWNIPALLDREAVEFAWSSGMERFAAAEQLADLMGRQGFDFLCPLPHGVVGFRRAGPLESETYRRALEPVSAVLWFLAQHEEQA